MGECRIAFDAQQLPECADTRNLEVDARRNIIGLCQPREFTVVDTALHRQEASPRCEQMRTRAHKLLQAGEGSTHDAIETLRVTEILCA